MDVPCYSGTDMAAPCCSSASMASAPCCSGVGMAYPCCSGVGIASAPVAHMLALLLSSCAQVLPAAQKFFGFHSIFTIII